jgi:hypothetical protein
VNDPTLAGLVGEPFVLLLFFAWGLVEATIGPIVPDVGLGLLALATPAALGAPLLAAIGGGVLGALILAAVRRRRPALADGILAAQPGLGQAGMASARQRIETRPAPIAFAQVGPGLPLKAYVVAHVDARPRSSPGKLAALAVLNRLTRIVPVVGAFALVGVIARPLDVPTAPAVGLYLLGWSAFYAAYWWARTF